MASFGVYADDRAARGEILDLFGEGSGEAAGTG
jgi:hypothetical protein